MIRARNRGNLRCRPMSSLRTGVTAMRFLTMRGNRRGKFRRRNASGLSRHAAPRLWRNRSRKSSRPRRVRKHATPRLWRVGEAKLSLKAEAQPPSRRDHTLTVPRLQAKSHLGTAPPRHSSSGHGHHTATTPCQRHRHRHRRRHRDEQTRHRHQKTAMASEVRRTCIST